MIVVGTRLIVGTFFCFVNIMNEQALSDIYVRISDKCKNPHIVSIFYQLSEETLGQFSSDWLIVWDFTQYRQYSSYVTAGLFRVTFWNVLRKKGEFPSGIEDRGA